MINTLKDLQSLLKLCRKQGVIDINLNGLIIKFGDVPKKSNAADDEDDVETDELSPEQLMFFSAPSAEGN